MLGYGPVEQGCLYRSATVVGDNRPDQLIRKLT
jgi:hypothetical protein